MKKEITLPVGNRMSLDIEASETEGQVAQFSFLQNHGFILCLGAHGSICRDRESELGKKESKVGQGQDGYSGLCSPNSSSNHLMLCPYR